jgi:hypothetical protein
MNRGAFKRLPGEGAAQRFGGTIHDLDAGAKKMAVPAPRVEQDDRRIITPAEYGQPRKLTIDAKIDPEERDLLRRAAGSELKYVTIRPKETAIALGPLGVVKLWKVQFLGQARVWTKPDGSHDIQGVGRMQRQYAPLSVQIGWYLLGAPIWYLRAGYLALKGRLRVEGAIDEQ